MAVKHVGEVPVLREAVREVWPVVRIVQACTYITYIHIVIMEHRMVSTEHTTFLL